MSGIPANIGDVMKGLHTVAQVADLSSGAILAARNLKHEIEGAVGPESSKKARTSDGTGYIVDSTQGSSSSTASLGRIRTTTPMGYSQLNYPQNCTGFGSSEVVSIGNKTSPPIMMRLGKQLGPIDSVENFLSLFSQSGTVSQSFGGRFQVNSDTRGRIYHAFRHNLRAPPTTTSASYGYSINAPYPSGANMLGPQGTITLAGRSVSNAPIQDLVDGGCYFSTYNKADLEDVSWNLNKFKLGPESTTSVGSSNDDQGDATISMDPGGGFSKNKLALLNDLPLMEDDKHRAISAIALNNTKNSFFSSKTSYATAPYRYDMVMKQGTVDYLFMNKGMGGCVVQVVVYRTKKMTGGIPSLFSEFNLSNQLEYPIRFGNKKKYESGFGTDNLDGTSRVSGDWVSDPSLPYLPSCRQIEQSQLPYKEVERVKIVLTSGERRPFQLKLGGHKYDPVNTPGWRKQDSGSTQPTSPPILDEHSYLVALVVNGVPMSREAINGSKSTIVGDTYCPADFQYTGVYTETIGAMAYKKSTTKNLFTNGYGGTMYDAIKDYNAGASSGDKLSSQPVVLTSQANAIRSPGLHTHGGASSIPS